MLNRPIMVLLSIVATCQLIAACGAKTKEGAKVEAASPAAVAKVAPSSDSPASADVESECPGQYHAGGIDYSSYPAGYLFVGNPPMCASKLALQDFCKSLQTRQIYLLEQGANPDAFIAEETAKTLDEDARAGMLSQRPNQVFEQSLQKCGLKIDQVRAKLVAEAEASISTGSTKEAVADAKFLLKEAPATAEALWKRECEGHFSEVTSGEGRGWEFSGNPAYKTLCSEARSRTDYRPTFKRQPDLDQWFGSL